MTLESRFSRLDNDVLFLIFELTRLSGTPTIFPNDLAQLSRTCRWLRNAIMPVLFKRIKVLPDRLGQLDFPPSSLWPYVRIITFRYSFQLSKDIEHLAAGSLSNVLLHMPNFHTSIFVDNDRFNGIPWPVLTAIISVPHLRYLHVHNGSICEVHYTPDSFSIPALVAPLTSLHIHQRDYRKYPRNPPADDTAISLCINRMNQSLESVILPIESAPLSLLSRKQWPRLRELALRGEHNVIPSHPHAIMDTLQQMPLLRVIKLEIAQSKGLGCQTIWPCGYPAVFPCPDLETLEVSYPHPQDDVYDHLPHTLRRLALRCWPRHYVHLLWPDRNAMRDLGWHSPILSASEMLRVLRRCHASGTTGNVEWLDIEFQGESGDMALFQFLPVAFPRLTFLQIHRYREDGSEDLSVADVASALAHLSHLYLLRVHLDFIMTPHPFVGRTLGPARAEFSDFTMATTKAANVFARGLGRSVEYVCFLKRHEHKNVWIPFQIDHDAGLAQERNAKVVEKRCGYAMNDEHGPSDFIHRRRIMHIEREEIA